MKLAFISVETTGLGLSHNIWKFSIITNNRENTDRVKYEYYIDLPDPTTFSWDVEAHTMYLNDLKTSNPTCVGLDVLLTNLLKIFSKDKHILVSYASEWTENFISKTVGVRLYKELFFSTPIHVVNLLGLALDNATIEKLPNLKLTTVAAIYKLDISTLNKVDIIESLFYHHYNLIKGT